MVKIDSSHKKLTIEEIKQFEINNGVKLTGKYTGFLLKWNGGWIVNTKLNKNYKVFNLYSTGLR